MKPNSKPLAQWRRARLELLVDQYGSLAAVARKAGVVENYLSQIRTGHRGLGHKVAADIEGALGLEPGWMSRPPDDAETRAVKEQAADYISDVKLQRVIAAWGSLTSSQKDDVVRRVDDAEHINQQLLDELLGRHQSG